MSELLASIEIPKFITRVKMSNKRRKKYYKKTKKKGWKPRNLPKTYRQKLEDGVYSMSSRGYLLDENDKKKLANPQTAGKPRYEVLSGNNLLSGYGSPHTRAKLVGALKDFYRPFVQDYIKENGPIEKYPLKVIWECHTVVEDDPNWDASNLFFYYKYFEDCLFEEGKGLKQLIPDDNVKYIVQPPGAKIIPVDNWDDRKFVFNYYYDDRNVLNRKPWSNE